MHKRNVTIALAILFATIFAFASHVFLQLKGDAYVAAKTEELGVELISTRESANNPYVIVAAGTTALIPVALSYFVLTVLWDWLPGRMWWQKGLVFSCFLLMLKSQLFREPLVGLVAGVPPWVVGISQLDVWVPGFVLGILLALGIHLSHVKAPFPTRRLTKDGDSS